MRPAETESSMGGLSPKEAIIPLPAGSDQSQAGHWKSASVQHYLSRRLDFRVTV